MVLIRYICSHMCRVSGSAVADSDNLVGPLNDGMSVDS